MEDVNVKALTECLSLEKLLFPDVVAVHCSQIEEHVLDNALALVTCEEGGGLLHPLEAVGLPVHKLLAAPAILLLHGFVNT